MNTRAPKGFARSARLRLRQVRQTARSRRQVTQTRWRIRLCSLRGGVVADQDVLGTRFLVYPEDRSSARYWIDHVDGPDVFASMRYLVPRGGTAFDVGAHFGLYAAEMSRRAGPTGRVHAFEPVPYTYWRLRETIALNRLENVTAERLAMASDAGTASMSVYPRGCEGWNTMSSRAPLYDGVAPETRIDVQVDTLDHYCGAREIDHVDFLKVDVEGFEREVFLGAAQMLSAHRVEAICFEVSDVSLTGAELTSRDVFEVLNDAGYGIYRFLDHELRFGGPMAQADGEWGNYFAFYRDPQSFL